MGRGRRNNITVKSSIIKYPYLQLSSTLTHHEWAGGYFFYLQHLLQSMQLMRPDLVMNMACSPTGIAGFLCKAGQAGIPNCILLTEKVPRGWGSITKPMVPNPCLFWKNKERSHKWHTIERETSKLSQVKTLMNFECCSAKEKAVQYGLYLERRFQWCV